MANVVHGLRVWATCRVPWHRSNPGRIVRRGLPLPPQDEGRVSQDEHFRVLGSALLEEARRHLSLSSVNHIQVPGSRVVSARRHMRVPVVWQSMRGWLWLQWPVAAGCGKPVAAMACGRWLWKALAAGAMLPRALLFSGTASADRT